MASLLSGLVSSFLLLRDFFGYVIPGAVLLAILEYAGVGTLATLPLSEGSIWVRAIVTVTASYVIGHVLAAIGYTLYDIFDWAFPGFKGQVAGNTTEEYLYYRYLFPSMFIEADRRDTLTILRVGLSWALMIGAFFLPSWFLCGISLGIGLFMYFNAYKSQWAAAKYRGVTLAAAKRAETNKIPIFDWNSSKGSKEKKPDTAPSEHTDYFLVEGSSCRRDS